jgi:hypothetical protein
MHKFDQDDFDSRKTNTVDVDRLAALLKTKGVISTVEADGCLKYHKIYGVTPSKVNGIANPTKVMGV